MKAWRRLRTPGCCGPLSADAALATVAVVVDDVLLAFIISEAWTLAFRRSDGHEQDVRARGERMDALHRRHLDR
jgi:hypothetical protein